MSTSAAQYDVFEQPPHSAIQYLTPVDKLAGAVRGDPGGPGTKRTAAREVRGAKRQQQRIPALRRSADSN